MKTRKNKSRRRYSIFTGTTETQIAMTYLAAYLTAIAFIGFLYLSGAF